MPRSKLTRRTESEIQSILSDFKNSGLSQRQFSVSRDIAFSTLSGWIRKQNPQANPKQPKIIPIGTFPSPALPLEIEIATGEVIRLCRGFNREDLRSILVELRRC